MAPPDLSLPEGRMAYLREYMPIKLGRNVFSKLRKRYWETPNIGGRPLVFAIEDFSSPGSMVHTRSALDVYLYGYDHDWFRDADGRLMIRRGLVAECDARLCPALDRRPVG